MKNIYIFLNLVLMAPLFAFGQSPQELFNLDQPESGDKHYIASQYVNCLPENDNAAGFSYTAQSGESFVGEIDPFMVFPPEEGDTIGDPDPNGNGNYYVGETPGSFNVSPTGAATYTIPIKLPQGINGMIPNLAITYNSQAGNGNMGYGWSISGLSAITRIGNDLYHDNNIDPVDFDDNDKFALDGNRLVLGSGTYGADGSQYTTEMYSGSRITAVGTQGSGPQSFKVETKDGRIVYYGNSTNSQNYILQNNAFSVNTWFINKIEDSYGNEIILNYYNLGNDVRIKEISYGGNNVLESIYSLIFEYDDDIRKDVLQKYILGNCFESKSLLKSIAIENNGQIVNSYTCFYNSENDENSFRTQLTSIQEFGVNNNSLRPIKFFYKEELRGMEIESWADDSYRTTNTIMDINGDGRADIIEMNWTPDANEKKDYNSWNYKIRHDNGFVIYNFEYDIHIFLKEILVGDFNGDRCMDFARVIWTHSSRDDKFAIDMIAFGQQDGTFREKKIELKLLSTLGERAKIIAMDHNGDGATEIIKMQLRYYDDNTDNVGIYSVDEQDLSIHWENACYYDFGYRNTWDWDDARKDVWFYYDDYTGDGKTDILIPANVNIEPDSESIFTGGKIITFDDNSTLIEHINGYDIGANGFHFGKKTRIFPGKFNYDNIGDLLVYDENSNWEIFCGDGAGSFKYNKTLSGIGELYNNYDKVYAKDFNGDGLSDIIEIRKIQDVMKADVYIHYVNGALKEKEHYTIDLYCDQENFYGGGMLIFDGRNPHHTNSDFNGDGKIDLYRNNCGENDEILFFGKNNSDNNKIIEIKKSSETFDCLSYNSIINSNYTHCYGTFDETNGEVIDFCAPIIVCTEHRINKEGNPIEHSKYGYEGFTFNRLARKALGFTSTTTKNMLNNVSIKLSYGFRHNYYLNVLSEARKEFYTGNYSLALNETEHLWTVNEIPVFDNAKSIFQYVERQNTKKYDIIKVNSLYENVLISTLRTQQLYSNASLVTNIGLLDSGNLGIDAPISNFDYQTKTENTYYPSIIDENKWIPHRLETVITTTHAPNEIDEIQKKKITYCDEADYLLNIESLITYESNESDFLAVKKQFEYHPNSYGRLTKETLSTPNYTFGEGNSQTLADRSTSFFYGNNNDERYLTKTINAKGHEVTIEAYDELFGKPLKVKDANGLITEYIYDNFGNQMEVIHPDGIIEKSGLRWADAACETEFPDAQYFAWSNSSGTTPVFMYYDDLNRKIGSKSYDFNGTEVYTKKRYDNKGRLEYEYAPKIGDNENITRYQYDFIDRAVRVDHHLIGEDAESEYYSRTVSNGLIQTQYYGSSSGEESTITKKYANGNTKEVTDEQGNVINYHYYANGQAKEIVAFGNTTSFEYDKNGNKTKMIDPSLGEINFENNPYGELMKRTDAKQQEKTYLYDRLGRLTQSTDHNGNIMQTIYDTQKAGLVSEVSLTTGAGSTDYLAHKIAYDYDQLLRVQSKTELINGQDYTYSYQYDDLGRTKYMTYPTGLKIRNKYNAKGFLKEILDANSTKSIWKVNADGYDKLGRLIGYMVNNNNGQAITTTKAFDEQTGLLTDIDTYSNSQQVQNLHYNYDILGNMSSRSQSTVDALAETFNYDALNRLTDATTRINGSINNTINYNYAANGNIQNISNLGSFTYAETPNAGPYAISGVDFDNGVDMPQPQNISYTTFDKVKSLTETGIGSLAIKYGLDQQRLYQTSTLENGTTKEKYFIGGLYEKEISEGVIKELCYISTPAGTIAIKETQDNVDNWLFLTHDHLGSVHCILNEDGELEQELSFDPYGNRRDPNTWKPFEDGTEPTYIIDRGYTFHEHWDDFKLINMNGRVYDPVIARFLSPDPYVQSPGYSQNFNRYSYVLNNPLKYTDPSGEIAHIILGAAVGGMMNWMMNGSELTLQGLGYFGIGAAAGALGAGVGAGVSSSMAGGSFGAGFVGSSAAKTAATSFMSGAAIGAGAGSSSGFVSGIGNAFFDGDNFGSALVSGVKTGLIAGASGGLIGGIVGGIDARMDNRHFITGKPPYKDVSLEVPFIGQDQGSMDCLLANSAMLDNYYGGTRTIEDFREIINALPEGAKVADYYSAAGFKIMGEPENAMHIIRTMEVNKFPTTITTYEGSYNGTDLFHNSTVTRVRMWTHKSKAVFWVNDPIKGANYRWTQKDLYKVISHKFVIGGLR